MTLWKPHKYQLQAVKFLVERAAAALFLDPGLGKTSCVYAAVAALKRAGLHEGTLVVAPRRPALSVWPKEQEKWSNFADISVGVVHGPLRERVVAGPRKDVYVTTYETLLWLIRTGWLRKLLRARIIRNIVFDELSKMKHTTTARFRTIKGYLPLFDRRWGLTGSPAANGLMDLFGECYALDLGRALGKYITYFRAEFFTDLNANKRDVTYPAWVLQQGAAPLIYDRVKDLALRISGDKHLKLPRLVTDVIRVDLDAKARKVYDTMEDQFFAQVDAGLITASAPGSVGMKLRQMASGAVYEDIVDPLTGAPRSGARKWLPVHDAKLEALDDLLEELNGQQLLTMYYFGHDLARIRKTLGAVPGIGGGTSDADALKFEKQWNAGQLRHLLGHPDSMAYGLNFQESHAHHIAVFSPTWNFETFDQFIRRLLRQGNESAAVFVHFIVARDTVDEVIVARGHGKARTQNDFHAALESYRRSRN
jgi:SNF2 family DNA or RNA helicase